MRLKGKIIKWNVDKAFGFIAPNGGGDHVFIHKTALSNRSRTPQNNDVITFSITKDKDGRYCACDATFSGEKLKKKEAKKVSQFSVYLSLIFLATITVAFFFGYFPEKLLYVYIGLSILTYLAYAFDKSKAQRGAWRTQESTLHFLSLAGGWPGAALAQQFLRHKSSKREFRNVYWITAIINMGVLIWLYSSSGNQYLELLA
ncbi:MULTISPECIES: DUF1294 domain-containing protein [unclassified Colwellia]|uniref:DUF1294 domain-containing protein n=1 Tax=unclassified Colwellia TaxID=196834 RepID=UPI0015F76109|nr:MULTISPECIES: DUF1294 domain-containing protein [unclassified Colwellia]MBA6232192.1 cold shock and DUF1294 domain-containing protein [Colwellia sp. MB02u-7]MBA6237110.1 cold shock and DUF1294 domain-containing protein [Colwellia sp. MB02u-11]MBA6301626.1 cold shock and DUF1294 domain-containing protein [Colwellia sp. MB3u-22]MBA6311513.1 cold shock and DUF1294 domain-containing protein [Colwellia sp. MB3u-64]